MCSLYPPACCGCAAVWMGVAAGAAGNVCWQLRFTELALALKVEGRAAVSGKLSSPRSHTTDPRVASGSRLGVWQHSVPLERAAACLWSLFLPVPPQRDAVQSRAHSKGSSSQRGPKHLGSLHRGEGQPRVSNAQASAGWSVTNSCRVTWLRGKEVLNFRHCPLGRLLYRLQGAGNVFCFVLFFPKNQI